MKILLTAFEPFAGERVNPAMEAAALLGDRVAGAELVCISVPVVFGKSVEVVTAAIRREKPDAVLCIGQAGGRFELTPERVAINMDDARIPDEEGNQPIDRPVIPGGAPAYFSTLPIKAMVSAIREKDIPACVSNTAGTFVCNHLMYGVLSYLSETGQQIPAGFMHVPYLPSQVLNKPNTPCLSLGDITTGLAAAIGAIVQSIHAQCVAES